MPIDVEVVLVLFGGASALVLCPRGKGYKESPWVGYNCSPSRTLSLVFPNYRIWWYPNRTLSPGVILPPSCCNMGLCQPRMGLPSHIGLVPWVRILDSTWRPQQSGHVAMPLWTCEPSDASCLWAFQEKLCPKIWWRHAREPCIVHHALVSTKGHDLPPRQESHLGLLKRTHTWENHLADKVWAHTSSSLANPRATQAILRKTPKHTL
jgi:hypothetical protein